MPQQRPSLTHVPTPSLPSWLPPSDVGARRVECGRWWDAVRVPERLGGLALRALAERSGLVVHDSRDRVFCWLVAPGAAEDWRQCLPVEVFGVACRLLVPSLAQDHTRWVEWVVRPEPGWDGLTDPGLLREALTAAVAGTGGAR
ncbi:hypothetical protein ACTWP5_26460 [Streptomyces sp. 4N509B]|uniref:hypothetical protein n=1 Tax=Streptomyces sp. 4N509B TaxID=3457413 RepID=UPI003FCFD398